MFETYSKHAVLFGGAGFIGSELINALSNDNWRITVVTRRPHRHRNLLVVPQLKMVEAGDLSDDLINDLIGPADTVINLVGILNETRKASFTETHTLLPARIAQQSLQQKARKLIHLSALGGAVEAPSDYLKSRGHGEAAIQAIAQQGLDCTILRPSIVFGPGDSFSKMFRQMLSMTPLIFPLVAPNARVQPVYVKDVVRCIVHAIDAPIGESGSFDIAGPKAYTLQDMIRLIDEFSGMHHKIIGLGPSLSRLLAFVAQFAPNKPLTPDNLRSLEVVSEVREDTPAPYGIQPTRFEAVAASWLSRHRGPLDEFRRHAGR